MTSIVIDNGSYRMDNMGDVAMLQVCAARIRQRWPGAVVRVVVERPERLARALPDARPLVASAWPVLPVIRGTGRIRGHRLRWLERRAAMHAPRLVRMGKRWSAAAQPGVLDLVEEYHAAIRDADAVVCSGGGFINDAFHEHAEKVIHTLALAQGLGKPTAMFGAGIGPITDARVRRFAAPVLRRLDLVTLREPDTSPAELDAMGVDRSSVVVTGDDAIALALGHERAATRRGIGVNIRVAAHAKAATHRLPEIARTLRRLAEELDAPLVATPVRNHLSPVNDVDAVRQMFADADVPAPQAPPVDEPADLIRLIGGCRVVVTGAYHAAVFALAQGVPVVALCGGSHYRRKFGGLATQFGGGLELIDYHAADLPDRLNEAVRAASRFTDGDRLIAAARRQAAASEAAYRTFLEGVEAQGGVASDGYLVAPSTAMRPS